MTEAITAALANWIPYKSFFNGTDLLFRWLYTGAQPYTDPFFDETIARCLHHEINSKRYKYVSDAGVIPEWGADMNSLEPAAFIFHVSRCGSTLFSQALGMLPEHISLSEVPVFDEILRLRFRAGFDREQIGDLLKGAIRFYGAKRTGNEKRLFIKTDSWHLMFYDELRAIYPETPFIVLYREPTAVLHSNQRKKGMQGVYGVIEPELFGLSSIADELKHPDIYMSLVLSKYYEQIIKVAGKDKRTLLLDYNQGITEMMLRTGDFINMPISAAYQSAIMDRALYNAKYPEKKFEEVTPVMPVANAVLQDLLLLYNKIDALRKA